MSKRTLQAVFVVAATIVAPVPGHAQEGADRTPVPDVSDSAYGRHERNVLDFWRAWSDRPTPLVVFLHGGGFQQGDKKEVPTAFVREALRRGISVASVNYRLTNTPAFLFYRDGPRDVAFTEMIRLFGECLARP